MSCVNTNMKHEVRVNKVCLSPFLWVPDTIQLRSNDSHVLLSCLKYNIRAIEGVTTENLLLISEQ